jgi:hypothetical protein
MVSIAMLFAAGRRKERPARARARHVRRPGVDDAERIGVGYLGAGDRHDVGVAERDGKRRDAGNLDGSRVNVLLTVGLELTTSVAAAGAAGNDGTTPTRVLVTFGYTPGTLLVTSTVMVQFAPAKICPPASDTELPAGPGGAVTTPPLQLVTALAPPG